MNSDYVSNIVGGAVRDMAIRGDLIQFVGTLDHVMRFAGPQTKKVDLKGRVVLPGFIDTHSHMHDHTIQLWTRNHRDEVEKVMKRFSVTGKNYQELTHGIEVV